MSYSELADAINSMFGTAYTRPQALDRAGEHVNGI
jgi:hypothetical protein